MLLVSTLISFGSFVSEKLDADLILERADEQLLAGVAVEVAVGVAEADEVERLVAAELLVAGLQVDRRVAARPAVGVEVAAVDVHPDAAELVDELP